MIAVSEDRVDELRMEQFAERITAIINGGALALGLSIGHRTGLFDAMEDLPAASSDRIASEALLSERYVREWLGAMVTGGIIEFDARSDTYRLPPEHASLLTRRNSPNNLAVTAQFLPVMAAVEDRIVECFRNGGGVGYDQFDRFHEVMAEDSRQTVVAALFEYILPLADGLAARLREGIDVADIGCGMGRALIALASTFPASRFTGFDLSADAVADAAARAAELGLRNVVFEVRDLARLSCPREFDLVTAFDVIHDQVDPVRVLENVRSALRPGGTFLMQDIRSSSRLENNLDHPFGPFLYTISYNHCMTVSLAHDGAGLGTCWGRELALEMLANVGFSGISVHQLAHDVMNDIYVSSV